MDEDDEREAYKATRVSKGGHATRTDASLTDVFWALWAMLLGRDIERDSDDD